MDPTSNHQKTRALTEKQSPIFQRPIQEGMTSVDSPERALSNWTHRKNADEQQVVGVTLDQFREQGSRGQARSQRKDLWFLAGLIQREEKGT